MPFLIVERASVIVERRKLDKDRISIGRSGSSDIVLDDPGIGTSLAVLERQGGGYVLVDQGSMAGITHQGDRVSQLALKNGMRFEAFPFSFVYEDEGGAQVEEAHDSRLEATMAMDLSAPGEGIQLVPVGGAGFGPFTLKAGVNVVGRKPGLDIVIDSKTVSKEHAHVLVLPGELVLEDKGSANGTYVNKRRVTRESVRHGDLIQFGSVELRVVSEAEERGSDPMHATADIQVDSILLGGALDQQAQAMGTPTAAPAKPGKAAAPGAPAGAAAKAGAAAPKKKAGGAGKAVRLAAIGCLTMVLVVLMIVVILSGGGEEGPPPVDKAVELKLQQAKGILASGKELDAGITLVDEILQANPPEAVQAEAKALKDQLLAKKREPVKIADMTQEQLRDEANRLVSRGKILESVAYWERLVALDPGWERSGILYATLMFQVGLIYEGAGNAEAAVAVWKREQAVLQEAGPENVPHAKIRERLLAAGVSP